MSKYISQNDLAELISCEPNQFATMKRWLTKNKWPFEIDRRGFPKVFQQYHDDRMSGKLTESTDSPNSQDDDEISINTNAMLAHLKKKPIRTDNGSQTR